MTKGKRVYSFDVAESGNGECYLAITESVQGAPAQNKYQVIVFEEDAADFVDNVNRALAQLKKWIAPAPADSKTYSVENIRKTHRQAYAPWTAQDDERLTDLLGQEKSVPELARLFERNAGAINSRIKKLKL